MTYLWYGLVLVAMAVIAARISAFRGLSRVALRAPRCDHMPIGALDAIDALDAVEAGQRERLEAAAETWRELGFEYRGWSRSVSADAHDQKPVVALVMEHPLERVWACVYMNPLPEPGEETRASLHTFAERGHLLSTDGQAHLYLGDLPGTTIDDQYVSDPTGQLRGHLAARAGLGQPLALADAGDFLARVSALWAGYPDLLVSSGKGVWNADGTVRLRPATAWKLIGVIRRGQTRAARARAKSRQRKRPVAPDVDAEAFLRLEDSQEVRGSGGFSTWLFLGTLVVAIASFTTWFQDWRVVAMLVGVLILHELGHFAAMRAFGYRDTTIFFLPFLGAAASGRKRDATAVQQVVVSLMGPLPGIIIGLALLATDAPSQLEYKVAMLLLVLNILNLAPMLPFDGGHIVQRLIFSRQPWLDVGFHVLGTAALVGVSMYMDYKILMWVGIFLAASLPTQARRAAQLTRLRRSPEWTQPTDERLRMRAIFAAMGTQVASTGPFTQRAAHARSLRETLSAAPAGIGSTLLLLAVYLAALIGAPLLAAQELGYLFLW